MNTGGFNFPLSNITQSYAASDIPTLGIPAGVTYEGWLGFAGLQVYAKFSLATDGFAIAAVLDTSAFSQGARRPRRGVGRGVKQRPSRRRRRLVCRLAWACAACSLQARPLSGGPPPGTSRHAPQSPAPPHTHTAHSPLPPAPAAAFNADVLGRLDSVLSSVGSHILEASSAVEKTKEAALARLAAANVTLQNARGSLASAQAAFETAKSRVGGR